MVEVDLMRKGKEHMPIFTHLETSGGSQFGWGHHFEQVVGRARQRGARYKELCRMSFRYLWPGQTGRVRNKFRIEPDILAKLF